MNNKSRKAKGRYLQNIVRDKIIELYPVFTHTARKLFPYSIECKNREDFKGLYSHYKQATKHSPLEPMLIVKMNRKKPLCIIDLDHFFNLQKK
jgi:hypothetical protein